MLRLKHGGTPCCRVALPYSTIAWSNCQQQVDAMNHELSGKRVLIVEDEPLVALDYAAELAAAGAHVIGSHVTVHSALEAVRASGNEGIDLAVVDFVLADRNSEPLQIALYQRGIPFVVVSAYPRPLVRTQVSNHVLQKPVSGRVLCDELRDVCRAPTKP